MRAHEHGPTRAWQGYDRVRHQQRAVRGARVRLLWIRDRLGCTKQPRPGASVTKLGRAGGERGGGCAPGVGGGRAVGRPLPEGGRRGKPERGERKGGTGHQKDSPRGILCAKFCDSTLQPDVLCAPTSFTYVSHVHSCGSRHTRRETQTLTFAHTHTHT